MFFPEKYLFLEVRDTPPSVETIPDVDEINAVIIFPVEDDVQADSVAVEGRRNGEVDLTNIQAPATSVTPGGNQNALEVGGDRGQISVHYYVSDTSQVRKYYSIKYLRNDSPRAEDNKELPVQDDGVDSEEKHVNGSKEDEEEEDEEDNFYTDVSCDSVSATGSIDVLNGGKPGLRDNAGAKKKPTSVIGGASGLYMERKTYTPLQKWEYENGLDVDGVSDVKRWAIEVGLSFDGEDDAQKAKRIKKNNVIEPPKYGRPLCES